MKKKKTLGFTLIELMVVITIISILATMGINTFTTAQKKARDSRRQSDVRQLMSAIGTTADLNGVFKVRNDGDDANCNIDIDGNISGSCSDADSSNFLDASGGNWPVFPRGKMASGGDQEYTITYNKASNTSCICSPLEVANGGNAKGETGCSSDGTDASSGFVTPSQCTADCDYFCLAI